MAVKTKVVITGDSSSAVSAVNRLKTELGGLQSIAAQALKFSVIGAAAAAVAGLVSMTKNAIDAGDALAKMSQKTGVTVEDLSKLQYAAGLSGVSTESLAKGMTSLAVGMIEATTGAITPAAEQIGKFGIVLRNADGTVKSSRVVLGELADQFAAMPDGAQKTAAAVDIFGKRLGAEMIPLLNLGSKGLAEMGDEAERLGIVMRTELAKKSEEFNDNLSRLGTLSEAAGIKIANALVPALNELITQYLDAGKAGLGFWESVAGIGLSDPTKGPAAQIASINAEIQKLKKGSDGLSNKLADEIGGIGTADERIAGLERLRKYYELQQERQTGDGVASAQELSAKRVNVEKQLQTKIAELATLRGIAEGKVSADILLDDNKRTAAQIKNADALRKALSTAWQSSLKEAQAAGDEAAKLFDKAADVRQTGADRAADKRRSIATPANDGPFQTASGSSRGVRSVEEEFAKAASDAEQAAGLAKIAQFHNRTENAAKLAAQASKDAERAAKFAEQIDDPEASAQAIERATAIQEDLLKQQAEAKKQEQADLEARAAQQAELMAGLDAQLTELQNKAAALKVSADISEAEGALVQLQAELENLKDKTITVIVNQVNSSNPLAGVSPDGVVSGFAGGGYTGTGGKYKPAGIVHAREFVSRSEVVEQPGALAFLTRFNRIGMAALKGLPGYFAGGLVSNLRTPSLSSAPAAAAGSSGRSLILQIGGQSFEASMQSDPFARLTAVASRQALKRGGRKS